MSVLIDCDSHIISDALKIFYRATEVNTAHSFHKYVEPRTFLTCRYDKLFLSVTPVEFTYVFSIDKHLSEIMDIVNSQYRRFTERRKSSSVDDTTESLVVFFHRLYVDIALGFRKIRKQRSHFCKINLLDGYRFDQIRHL